MDLEMLKKKVSTYRSDDGKVRNVGDDLLMEILVAWEQWTGPAKGFYTALAWISTANNSPNVSEFRGRLSA